MMSLAGWNLQPHNNVLPVESGYRGRSQIHDELLQVGVHLVTT